MTRLNALTSVEGKFRFIIIVFLLLSFVFTVLCHEKNIKQFYDYLYIRSNNNPISATDRMPKIVEIEDIKKSVLEYTSTDEIAETLSNIYIVRYLISVLITYILLFKQSVSYS